MLPHIVFKLNICHRDDEIVNKCVFFILIYVFIVLITFFMDCMPFRVLCLGVCIEADMAIDYRHYSIDRSIELGLKIGGIQTQQGIKLKHRVRLAYFIVLTISPMLFPIFLLY